MRLTPLRRAGLAGVVAAAALVAVVSTTTTAFAQPTTDDGRATAYDGNVDINHKDACTVGGLTGTPIAPEKFTFTGGVNQQDLDITAVPANTTITGVVVKGGDAYNVYLAAKLGALPWNDLRSPLNNGGKVPAISHWYACGVEKDETTTISTTTTTTTTSGTSTSTTTTTVSSTPATTSASSSVSTVPSTTVTTTTAAAVPVDEDDLASTGFGSAWLLGLGAALLVAGAAVLLVLRRRRA